MSNVKIPKINLHSRKICSISCERENYQLKDCYNNVVWPTKNGEENELTKALQGKTRKYVDKYKIKRSVPTVWALRIKQGKKWVYKNIASCNSMKNLSKEINTHIKQWVVKTGDKSTKATKYAGLWNDGVSEIEFREILVEDYFEAIKDSEWRSMNRYIRKLVNPGYNPDQGQAEHILLKLRAEYIEGRLAFELSMRENEGQGIWNPSGIGIDGDIYDYYKANSDKKD